MSTKRKTLVPPPAPREAMTPELAGRFAIEKENWEVAFHEYLPPSDDMTPADVEHAFRMFADCRPSATPNQGVVSRPKHRVSPTRTGCGK